MPGHPAPARLVQRARQHTVGCAERAEGTAPWMAEVAGTLAFVGRQLGPPPQREDAPARAAAAAAFPAPATCPTPRRHASPVAAPARAAGTSSRARRSCRRESPPSRALRSAAFASLAAQGQTLDRGLPQQDRAPAGRAGEDRAVPNDPLENRIAHVGAMRRHSQGSRQQVPDRRPPSTRCEPPAVRPDRRPL